MLTSNDVQAALYKWTQAAFIGTQPAPFSPEDLAYFFEVAAEVEFLDVAELERWPSGRRAAAREVITEYITFVSIMSHLRFPPGFLEGTSATRLGAPFLRYVADHGMPFPQLQGRSRMIRPQ